MQIGRVARFTAGILAVLPAMAWAAAPETLGSFQDWTAQRLKGGGKVECYALSKAKSSEPAKLKRAAYATVTIRPKGATEVNLVAGAPWKAGADVKLTATGVDFALFTKGDGAWAYDGDADKAIVAAFKKGKKAMLTGLSAKGEKLTDSFSLAGFPDALAKAAEGCK